MSLISRLIPTLIIRFLFFTFILGCIDLDESGNKTFLSLHLNVEDVGALAVSIYWLVDSRPFIGFQIVPFPIGYICWIPSHEPEDEDDDDLDLPNPNGHT